MGNDEKSTARPPEPPTAPLGAPIFEERNGSYWCKVPGCSKAGPFTRINSHLSRIHGLTIDGSVAPGLPRREVPRAQAPVVDANVRLILQGTERALIEQAIRIIENAKNNLAGKLSEMEALKAKAAKLERIALCLRELI